LLPNHVTPKVNACRSLAATHTHTAGYRGIRLRSFRYLCCFD
jgi:hypothetical protein